MYIRTHCVSAILAQEYLSKNVCNPAGPYSCTTKTKLFTQTLLGLNSCMSFITIYLHIGMGNYFQTDFAIFVNLIYIYIYITHLFHIMDAKKLKNQSPLDTRALGCLVIILKCYRFSYFCEKTNPQLQIFFAIALSNCWILVVWFFILATQSPSK